LLKNETDDEFSNESPDLSVLRACAQGSLGLGNLVKKRCKPRSSNQNADEGGFEQRAVNGRVGVSHGYTSMPATRLTQTTKTPASACCDTAFVRR